MHEAMLLLGATGAGKTPLGALLEQGGLAGRRCHHLDFGALLRAVAGGDVRLSRSYRLVVQDALERGRLLEDDEWHVAEAVLDEFVEGRHVKHADLVVLNGVPRHEGQAEIVARTFDVETVVHLDTTPAVLRRRIREDAGGDRAGRADDHGDLVEARLLRFERRTRPLLAHYQGAGARILRLPVAAGTRAAEFLPPLLAAFPP